MKAKDCLPKHCVQDPIPYDCSSYCLRILAEAATVEEKVLILGLRTATAQAVFNAFNSPTPIQTFNDLAEQLTDTQVNELQSKFSQTTAVQRAYFQLNMKVRQDIIEAIKALPWNPGDYEV